MTGKRVFTAALCAALVCTMLLAAGCSDKDEPTAKGTAQEWNQLIDELDALGKDGEAVDDETQALPEDRVLALVRSTAQIAKMEDFFDQDTPYILFRVCVMGATAEGKSEEEAFEYAREMVNREQAALWYAEEHDIEVTDEGLRAWLESVDGPEREQAVFEKACQKAEVSFDFVNSYIQRQYRMLYILELAHQADEKVNEEAMTAEYKASDYYKNTEKIFENCEKIYKSGEDRDLEKVLAADIWY